MSRLRVLNVYSADGVLNQRTRQVPVNGLTLRVQTDRETLGEMQEMLNMGESRCENCSTGSDHRSSTASRSSRLHRWLGHPSARRRLSSPGGDRSVHQSCIARTCPMVSPDHAVCDTRLSGVVEELIVADPQGSVPGLIVGPTVVGGVGHAHVFVCCVVL